MLTAAPQTSTSRRFRIVSPDRAVVTAVLDKLRSYLEVEVEIECGRVTDSEAELEFRLTGSALLVSEAVERCRRRGGTLEELSE